jgi:hypothetical protein
LERAEWALGDAGDFLRLSADERRYIETKLALAVGLRQRREHLGLTQMEVARRFGSSQSRVAKMEAADRTVSTDLLLLSLFRLGASRRDIARLLSQKPRTRAA